MILAAERANKGSTKYKHVLIDPKHVDTSLPSYR